MVSEMPERPAGESLDRTVIDFEEVEVGKEYRVDLRNPETMRMEETVVKVKSKERNETTDGTPGAKILSFHYRM